MNHKNPGSDQTGIILATQKAKQIVTFGLMWEDSCAFTRCDILYSL